MTKQRKTVEEGRTHRATSADGTEITATVYGEGPPLILLPAGPADAGTAWGAVLPYLTERFTCHLLAPRGRGRSGDHPDHSPERLIEDIATYAEGLSEHVTLVEWGSFVGAAWSLFAAGRVPGVEAVVSFDPLVIGVAGDEEAAELDGIFERIGALVDQGRLEEAALRFPREMAEHGFYTEADMAGGAAIDLWSASVDNIPTFFLEMSQVHTGAHVGPRPDPADPAQLAQVGVPVLLLHGTRSHPMNVELVRFVADHLPDREVRAIEGAGHYGPMTHPQQIARELVGFLEGVRTAV
jgi:pimeloyl-ACP methyl ester carboxylesterase